MFSRTTWLLILASGCRGCGCTPDLPDVPDDAEEDTATTDSEDTEETAETGETVEADPCLFYEVESNNTLSEATPIDLHKLGCGEFGSPADPDYWSFVLTEDAPLDCVGWWLAVTVEHQRIGSFGDASLTLSSGSGEAALVLDMTEHLDPELVFPAVADTYTALIAEETGQGDKQGYGYELLVTTDKPPVCWDSVEDDENNNASDAAEYLDFEQVDTAGASFETSVLGWNAALTDQDWYTFIVPDGRHTVTLDIDSASYGSAAVFKLVVEKCPWSWSTGSCIEPLEWFTTVWVNEDDWEKDPYAEFASDGDELWSVRPAEVYDRSGHAYWYLLTVGLEESS